MELAIFSQRQRKPASARPNQTTVSNTSYTNLTQGPRRSKVQEGTQCCRFDISVAYAPACLATRGENLERSKQRARTPGTSAGLRKKTGTSCESVIDCDKQNTPTDHCGRPKPSSSCSRKMAAQCSPSHQTFCGDGDKKKHNSDITYDPSSQSQSQKFKIRRPFVIRWK